jgi:uncharacterized membrane protein YgcG
MNSKLLLLAISVAAFSSCTTLYKSGQTPDDVYFSPVRLTGVDKEEEQEQRDEVKTYGKEDRTIRMGINDPRYRNFNNDYSYTPYSYGFNYGYYYNPYYWPYPVYSSVYTMPYNPKNTTPRTANLATYNSGNIKTYPNPKSGSTRPVKSYNNSNNGSAVGNVIRQLFTPGETSNSNYSNGNSSNSTRSYSPSSSGSTSSGSSSSGGGGGISRPSRGGGN